MISASRQSIDSIREKIECGERLSSKEAQGLWDESIDLHELGELANLVRERKNGDAGYYNINTHLNPTNVCVYRCTFCAFRADLRDDRGYWMTDEQILQRGQEAVDAGRTSSPERLRFVSQHHTYSPRRVPNSSSKSLDACRNQLVLSPDKTIKK